MKSPQPPGHIETVAPEDYVALLSALNQTALVSMTDANGDIIYANDKFVEVSKYKRKELMGQNHRILKSGDQPQQLFVDLWKTISSGNVWRGETKNKAKDGTYYWVDTSITPILDDAGKPQRYISVRFVVTDKKKAEQFLEERGKALERTEKAMLNVLEDMEEAKNKAEQLTQDLEKYKLALDNTSDHVVVTDPEGVILYANPAVQHITGFAPAEVIGKKVGTRELWGGLMDKEFYQMLWHTIKEEKQTFAGEIKNKRKDGTEYYAFTTISPIFDKKKRVIFFVGIERDITKEKEVDRAKTEFVSLASHQLRTPLSTIGWYAEMLLAGDAGKPNAEQKRYLNEIYNGNQRMTELVNALLNVSRIDLGTLVVEPRPTNIIEMAQNIVKDLEPRIFQRRIDFKEQYDKIPKIKVDPKLLRMVIENLATNAVKYTAKNGKVTLAITKERDHILISIKDTGYGIPKSQHSKIFSKLFRADNVKSKDTEGTGLGLYIVKSIVDYSGGKIWFTSAENKGTTFFVTLPLSGMKPREGSKTLS